MTRAPGVLLEGELNQHVQQHSPSSNLLDGGRRTDRPCKAIWVRQLRRALRTRATRSLNSKPLSPKAWPGFSEGERRNPRALNLNPEALNHFLRGSSDKIATIQRRLAWPLRKDDTHTNREVYQA